MTLASVAVNKAADYITGADEVVRASGPAVPSAIDDEGAETGSVGTASRRPASRRPRRPTSTVERLQAEEAKLDTALSHEYERFCRGEVTARALNDERRRLIGAFNHLVRGENIRYRSMLRRLP